jgi:hypothetical protein
MTEISIEIAKKGEEEGLLLNYLYTKFCCLPWNSRCPGVGRRGLVWHDWL